MEKGVIHIEEGVRQIKYRAQEVHRMTLGSFSFRYGLICLDSARNERRGKN